MEYPVKCKLCSKLLYGPVKYCPFCGHFETVFSSEAKAASGVSDVDADHDAGAFVATKQVEEKTATVDGQDGETPEVAYRQGDALPMGSSDKPKIIEPVEADEKRESTEKQIDSERRINVGPADVSPPPPPPRRWLISALCMIGLIGSLSIFMLMKHDAPPENGKSSAPTKVTDNSVVPKPKGTANSAAESRPEIKPQKVKEITKGNQIKILPADGSSDKQVEAVLDRGKEQGATVDPDRKASRQDLTKEPLQKDKEEKVGDVGGYKAEAVENMINKGISLYEKKQYNEAIDIFKAILRIVPNNSVAKYCLENSMANQKQTEGAGEGVK